MKKRILFFTLLMVILPTICLAGIWGKPTFPQTVSYFARAYGNHTQDGDDAPYEIVSSQDGGYIFAGYNALDTNWDDLEASLGKIDKFGVMEWHLTIDGGGAFNYDSFGSVMELRNGDIIATGNGDSWGEGGYDIIVARFTSAGAIVWAKSIGTVDDEGLTFGTLVDDGIILVSYTDNAGAGGYDGVIMKLDFTGAQVWSKLWGGSNNDYFTSITNTVDGGFILTGKTLGFGAGQHDCMLLRFDSQGEFIWGNAVGLVGNFDQCDKAIESMDGGFIYGASLEAGVIGKFDKDGNHLWDYQSDEIRFPNDIFETSDGGIIVVSDSVDYYPLISKLDEYGTSIWSNEITTAEAFDGWYRGVQTPDGGFFLAGEGYTYGTDPGTTSDYIFGRTDPDGVIQGTTTAITNTMSAIAATITPFVMTKTDWSPTITAETFVVDYDTQTPTNIGQTGDKYDSLTASPDGRVVMGSLRSAAQLRVDNEGIWANKFCMGYTCWNYLPDLSESVQRTATLPGPTSSFEYIYGISFDISAPTQNANGAVPIGIGINLDVDPSSDGTAVNIYRALDVTGARPSTNSLDLSNNTIVGINTWAHDSGSGNFGTLTGGSLTSSADGSGDTTTIRGALLQGSRQGSGDVTDIKGAKVEANATADAVGATATNATGGDFVVNAASLGASNTMTLTNAYGFRSLITSNDYSSGASTITNAYGGYFYNATGSGDITNFYQIYIEDPTKGGTSNYSIYSAGGMNVFAGGLRSSSVTSDPCGTYPEGAMFYNDTSNYPCYCDQAGADLKFSDNLACF